MEFRLLYEGPLRANGGIQHKQDIRRAIHTQLSLLWQQSPLVDNPLLIEPNSTASLNILHDMSPFLFAPRVCTKLKLVAELDITLLRPEAPGALITQAGDIDNRLKTLFDALRMPTSMSEVPAGDQPGPGEAPFHCLLEDDNLISALSVRSDRLLQSASSPSDVVLLIRVVTIPTLTFWQNQSIT